jgi:UrcA family protein
MNIDTHNPTRIAAAVALFAALAALAAGAQAADVPQVHVKYGDLNLRTTAGATVLYQRIRGAAGLVCGVSDTRDLARLAQAKACAAHTVAEAVAAVNAPALTGVYEVKMGDAGMRLAAIR